MLSKTCPKCGIEKSLDEFGKDNGKKNGLRSHCKVCIAAKRQSYFHANRKRSLQAARKYHHNTLEYQKARSARWCKNNPDKHALKTHNYRARKRNALGRGLTHEQWQRMCRMVDNRCVYCGEQGKLTLDHVMPLNNGGLHDSTNILPACLSCNTSKRDKDLLEWFDSRFEVTMEQVA